MTTAPTLAIKNVPQKVAGSQRRPLLALNFVAATHTHTQEPDHKLINLTITK